MTEKRNTMEDLLLGGVGLDDDDDDDDDEEDDNAVVTTTTMIRAPESHLSGSAAAAAAANSTVLKSTLEATMKCIPQTPVVAAAAIHTLSSSRSLPSSTLSSQGLIRSGSAFSSPVPLQQSSITHGNAVIHNNKPTASPMFVNQEDFEPMPYFPPASTSTGVVPTAAAVSTSSILHYNHGVASSNTSTSTLTHMQPPTALVKSAAVRRNALQLGTPSASSATSSSSSTHSTTTGHTFTPITAAAPLNDPFLYSNSATVPPPAAVAEAAAAAALTITEDEAQLKAKRDRIVLFTKILMKYLESKDPTLHTAAKAVIKECADRNRAGDPAYASVSQSMQGRLKSLLIGTSYWSRAEAYLEQFLAKNHPLVTTSSNNNNTATTTTSMMASTESHSSIMMPPPPSHSIIAPSSSSKGIHTSFSCHPSSHLVPHHGMPSTTTAVTQSVSQQSQGPYSLPTSSSTIPNSSRTLTTTAGLGQAPNTVLSRPLDMDAAATLEARKKEEMNAKRKIQRKEAAARKKAKTDLLTSVSTPLNDNLSTTLSTTTSVLGPGSSSLQSRPPMTAANTVGPTLNPSSSQNLYNPYPLNTSTIMTEDSKQVKSKKSRSSTPIISNISGVTLSTTHNSSTSTTTMIDTVMEGDSAVVKASPVTLAKKKKDTKSAILHTTITSSSSSSSSHVHGKKVEEKEYYDWMEMLDHATPIHVQSLALLLGQDADIKDDETNRSSVRLLEEQKQLFTSLVGPKPKMEEDSLIVTCGVVQGWSQRNLVSARMAWATLRLAEQGQEDETPVKPTMMTTPSLSTSKDDSITNTSSAIDADQATSKEDLDKEYNSTPVTEWFNEERAEEDAALALLSEATQLYVKSLLEKSIQTTYIRQNVDGIRLWHIQQAAAVASSKSGDSDSSDYGVEKKLIPPLYLRLGCDVRRQRALVDGNSAKICQRMEEALARRDNVYSNMMISNDPMDVGDEEEQVKKLWLEDENDLSNPQSLFVATSMGDLARKPKLPSVAQMASKDAKMFFDVFGGKDYAQSAPLGRMSKNTWITREDLMGPGVMGQTKCHPRELSMYPSVPW